MKKNFFNNASKKIKVYSGAIAIGALSLLPYSAKSQTTENINNSKNQLLMESYKTIDSLEHVPNVNSINYHDIKQIKNLENYLGEQNGLYNLFNGNFFTSPKSGEGSIVFINGEAYVNFIPTGSGYKKLLTAKWKAQHEDSRDMSTVWSEVGNFLGLNDSEMKRTIMNSTDIDTLKQYILKDKYDGIVDIVLIGNEVRNGNANNRSRVANHRVFDKELIEIYGDTIPNHILLQPGQTGVFPVKPILIKDGYVPVPVLTPAGVPVPRKSEDSTKVITPCPPVTPCDQYKKINMKAGPVFAYNFGGLQPTDKLENLALGFYTTLGEKAKWGIMALVSQINGTTPYENIQQNVNLNENYYGNIDRNTTWGTVNFNGKSLQAMVTYRLGNSPFSLGLGGRVTDWHARNIGGTDGIHVIISEGTIPSTKSSKSGGLIEYCRPGDGGHHGGCDPKNPIHDTIYVPQIIYHTDTVTQIVTQIIDHDIYHTDTLYLTKEIIRDVYHNVPPVVGVTSNHSPIDERLAGLKYDLMVSFHYDMKRGGIFGIMGIPLHDKNIDGSKADVYAQAGVRLNLFPANAYKKVSR